MQIILVLFTIVLVFGIVGWIIYKFSWIITTNGGQFPEYRIVGIGQEGYIVEYHTDIFTFFKLNPSAPYSTIEYAVQQINLHKSKRKAQTVKTIKG